MQGTTLYDSFHVESVTDTALSIRGCIDVSGIRVIHSELGDVTPTTRDSRLPQIYDFVVDEGALKLDRIESWTGEDFCG